MDDRRKRYVLRAGRLKIAHQQCMSSARRLMREFATQAEVDELLELYHQRVAQGGEGDYVKKE